MVRNHTGAMSVAGRVNMVCLACGHRTQRVYNDERLGYGVCHCGGTLQRAGALADERRAAKAKRELQGGPIL